MVSSLVPCGGLWIKLWQRTEDRLPFYGATSFDTPLYGLRSSSAPSSVVGSSALAVRVSAASMPDPLLPLVLPVEDELKFLSVRFAR